MARDDQELFERIVHYLGLSAETTRRGFIKATLGTAAGLTVLGTMAKAVGAGALVILDNAEGVLVGDSTRCTGCRRCELACTEYNDGKSSARLARIKVGRNLNFGPRDQQAGFERSSGQFGNFRLIQDTCKQCPHPVPCATACPNDAIVLDEQTGARVVDPDKCKGCRVCQRACPWDVMTFDDEAEKASKCFLCNGQPLCVAGCPNGALQYISWRDLTKAVPIRQVGLPVTKDFKSAGCDGCH